MEQKPTKENTPLPRYVVIYWSNYIPVFSVSGYVSDHKNGWQIEHFLEFGKAAEYAAKVPGSTIHSLQYEGRSKVVIDYAPGVSNLPQT